MVKPSHVDVSEGWCFCPFARQTSNQTNQSHSASLTWKVENGTLEDYCPLPTGGAIHFHVSHHTPNERNFSARPSDNALKLSLSIMVQTIARV